MLAKAAPSPRPIEAPGHSACLCMSSQAAAPRLRREGRCTLGRSESWQRPDWPHLVFVVMLALLVSTGRVPSCWCNTWQMGYEGVPMHIVCMCVRVRLLASGIIQLKRRVRHRRGRSPPPPRPPPTLAAAACGHEASCHAFVLLRGAGPNSYVPCLQRRGASLWRSGAMAQEVLATMPAASEGLACTCPLAQQPNLVDQAILVD